MDQLQFTFTTNPELPLPALLWFRVNVRQPEQPTYDPDQPIIIRFGPGDDKPDSVIRFESRVRELQWKTKDLFKNHRECAELVYVFQDLINKTPTQPTISVSVPSSYSMHAVNDFSKYLKNLSYRNMIWFVNKFPVAVTVWVQRDPGAREMN